jgi:hypothetical protein
MYNKEYMKGKIDETNSKIKKISPTCIGAPTILRWVTSLELI